MMEYLSPRLQPNSPQLTELLSRIGQSWRQSGELQPLLATAVTELRAFLKTDCVQICQLQSEARSQVLVESRQEQRSLSGLSLPQRGTELSFPVDTLLRSTSISSIVDVTMQRIRHKSDRDTDSEAKVKPLQNSALPMIQAEALAEMGVRSLLLVPLYSQTECWGMILVYYSFPRTFLEADLETVQLMAEQLSMVLGQSHQPPKSDPKSQQAIALNQIIRQLHLIEPLNLEAALVATVAAFEGIGGRLYLLSKTESSDANPPTSASVQLFTNGVQPATSAFTKYAEIEQYRVWQNHFNAHDDLVWAISDLAQEPELQPLESVFQPTAIRSLLMVPLWYQQQQRGYLTLFRSEHQPWSAVEMEMAHELGIHFVAAVQRSQGQTQLNRLATTLEQQVQQRTADLQQLVDRQQVLLRVTVKIRQSLDLEQIFRTTTQELCRVVQAERVAVYRFNADWGGEFVNDFEFAASEWDGLSKLGVNLVWNDTYLQETQGGRYRFKETFVVEDIYTANLAPCHIESLEQYQIRSHAIAPIFVGTQLWGLLAMYQHSGPRAWAEADVQFLNHVSEQLGIAIQQANLLHQTREQTQQLQQLADRQLCPDH